MSLCSLIRSVIFHSEPSQFEHSLNLIFPEADDYRVTDDNGGKRATDIDFPDLLESLFSLLLVQLVYLYAFV